MQKWSQSIKRNCSLLALTGSNRGWLWRLMWQTFTFSGLIPKLFKLQSDTMKTQSLLPSCRQLLLTKTVWKLIQTTQVKYVNPWNMNEVLKTEKTARYPPECLNALPTVNVVFCLLMIFDEILFYIHVQLCFLSNCIEMKSLNQSKPFILRFLAQYFLYIKQWRALEETFSMTVVAINTHYYHHNFYHQKNLHFSLNDSVPVSLNCPWTKVNLTTDQLRKHGVHHRTNELQPDFCYERSERDW